MTVVAWNISGLECGISRAPMRKRTSHTRRGLVFCSFCGTCEYSQLLPAMKSALVVSIARAISRCVRADDIMNLNTSGGRAFWGLTGGSSALYALVCRRMLISVFPVVFFVGSGRPLETKADATWLTAFLAVVPETWTDRGLNVPHLTACMKAPRILIFLRRSYPSKYGSSMLHLLDWNSSQIRQLRAYLSCVWLVTPSFWACSAPESQSKK